MLLSLVSLIVSLLPGQSGVTVINASSFNTMSWFIGYYYLIFLIAALFLNKFLNELNERQYLTFLLTLFAIISFSWSNKLFNSIFDGCSALLTGIFLYSLGGFIRRYEPLKCIRSYGIIAVLAIVYVLVLICFYNENRSNMQNHIAAGNKDYYTYCFASYSLNNIFIIILAVSLLELFTRIKLSNSKLINLLGSATFMVYLVHDNSFLYSLLKRIDWVRPLHDTPVLFLVMLAKYVLLVFVGGVAAYILYLLTGRFLHCIKPLIFKKEVEASSQ